MTMCLDVDDFYCPQKQKQHSITYVVFKGFNSLMRLWCDSSNKIRRHRVKHFCIINMISKVLFIIEIYNLELKYTLICSV